MLTDISLQSSREKIVIDAKYYQNTLSHHFGTKHIHSSNLYQIYSYLSNLEKDSRNPLNQYCSGMLLYPKVSEDIAAAFDFGRHTVRVSTIDLNRDWKEISDTLLSLVNNNNVTNLPLGSEL